MKRNEKINKRVEEIGTRHRRKLRKYSKNFNEMFKFFFLISRKGIINFCGSPLNVNGYKFGLDSRESFRLHEDGYYKNGKPIITKHPNILKNVLMGKKGLGLWFDQWAEGISDNLFTYEEIISEFDKLSIEIPEPFLIEFRNLIEKKKTSRNLSYLEYLRKNKK
jgi:hypothetical protein